MGCHPRIESRELSSLATIRSRNSELWLVNNARLEEAILGYAAKFAQRYRIKLYGLAIEGNHLHSLAEYPNLNRAGFQRDFNACVARAIPRYVSTYPGGRFWARRYSSEFVPEAEDIEEYFFYLVLQPVKDGLVDRISDYPGYNCFSDAINGVKRKFKVINWAAYNERKRWQPSVSVKDFTEEVELVFARIPGYEDRSQKEYRTLMLRKLEERRLDILSKRSAPACGKNTLLRIRPGSRPFSTKTSTRYSHRPRILCVCPIRRERYKAWYFDVYFAYQQSSSSFRSGNLTVPFPEGTYRPTSSTPHSSEP